VGSVLKDSHPEGQTHHEIMLNMSDISHCRLKESIQQASGPLNIAKSIYGSGVLCTEHKNCMCTNYS
jgi:hypothetical protein